MQWIGLLGGGQLGRMLIQAGMDLDLHIGVLDKSPDSPCAPWAHRFAVGNLQDPFTLRWWAQPYPLLTYEIEDIHAPTLLELAQTKKVFPPPQALAIIQDKGTQKQFYQKNHIPTADFVIWDGKSEIHFPFPCIQKKRRGGYDGRGVQVLTSPDKAWQEPSVLEKKVSIQKEFSLLAARNANGQIVLYPPVESVFHPEQHVVEYLFAPAELPLKSLHHAQEITRELAHLWQIVGLLAVEFFLTTQDEVLVNEAAPRPHNTAHHTLRSAHTSQFEQHWRALLNLPLGNPTLHHQAAMVNILGKSLTPALTHALLAIDSLSIHWYGKKEVRPFRKMGHLILLDKDPLMLRQKVQRVHEIFALFSEP
ncbi:MAG: 5-(carboxyamino)imidazole ribonucleotide synthase [Bacteroidia bacterium]